MFQSLAIKNFMLFKKAEFQFGDKLNVLIGENGSGKTQLLKLLYALGKISSSSPRLRLTSPKVFIDYRDFNGAPKDEINGPLKGVFNVDQTCDLIHLAPKEKTSASSASIVATMQLSGKSSSFHITIERGMEDADSNDSSGTTTLGRATNMDYLPEISTDVLFFQSREILSIYKGFRSLNDKYRLPYDLSVTETISRLGMPYLKETPKVFNELIKELESHIKGKIYLDNEQFYFRPDGLPLNGNHDLAVDMAAEGWRKLGMLLQVLKNGELHSGMTLLWDEPEANLNPKLIRLIAKSILELSKMNIQVFIATQSLFLVNEMEILLAKQKITDGVRFFNLQNGKAPQQGDSFSALKNTLLLDEALKQSDRYMDEEV